MWLKLFASLGLYIWCYEICESDANVATADNDEMKRYDERVLKNSCTYPQKAFDILIKKMCPIAEPFCIIDKPFDSLSQMHFRCATALHRENNRVLVLNSSELLSIIADDAEEMGLPRCMLTAFISPECIFTARMAQYFNVLPLLFPQLRIVAIDATIFSKLNSRYGISGTPTIILWVDGVALARMDEAPFSVKAFKDFIQRWTDLEYASNFRLDVNSIPGPLSILKMPAKASGGKGSKGGKGDVKIASKAPKKKEGGGGKAKKKKWSKGKVRDKLNNMVLFDQATYDKLYKEVVTYKLITPSVVSERLKVRASLAKQGLKELLAKGLIKCVVHHGGQLVYTRSTKADESSIVE